MFDVIVYSQSDYRDIKFSIIYVALVVVVTSAGLSPATAAVLDIWDIPQFLVHVKSSSVSQLIKGKLRDLQKLLKYFIMKE